MTVLSWMVDRHRRLLRMRPGLFRVGAYFTALAVVFGACGMRRARAELGDRALELGRQMAELAMTSNQDTTQIVFNGQKLTIGSAVTRASVDDVLGHYGDYCQSKASAFLQDADDSAKAGPVDPEHSRKSGFVRMGDGNEGVVICFVQNGLAKQTGKEAAAEIAKTGQLGAVGGLRYAYVRRNKEKAQTLVLTAWTDDSFNLLAAFPKDPTQDAPGEDFGEVPRVPSSVRVMATRATGTPFAANVYRTTEAPETIVAFYDHELASKGWLTIDPANYDGPPAHGYLKDGVVVLVTASKNEGMTFVGLGLSGVSVDPKREGAR